MRAGPENERETLMRVALLELCMAVGNHPDSMTSDGSLHAAFLKATEVLQKAYPPPTLLRAIKGSIDV